MKEKADLKRLVKLNVEKTQKLMEQKGLDAIIVNRMDNFMFLTGYYSVISLFYLNRFSAVLTTNMDFPVIMPRELDVEDVKTYHPWFEDIRGTQIDMIQWADLFDKVLKDYGLDKGHVGLDPWIPYFLYEAIRKKMPSISFTDASEILVPARSLKNEEEIKLMKNAARVSDIGMQACLNAIGPGVTENQVASAGSRALVDAGAFALATYMVASGVHAEIGKESPTDKKIEKGDSVVLDGGAYVGGYCAEFARTKLVESPSSELKDIYRIVYESEHKAIDMLRPGNYSYDVDAAAREVIRKAGYGEYEHQCITGHGLGLSVHECPLIGPPSYTENVKLEKDMVVNVEPGIFKPRVGGARLEDNVLITEDEPQIISKTAYEPYI